MHHSWQYVLCIVLLMADLIYSGLQYYHQPLDGDISWNLVPAEEVNHVLADPFGIAAWATPTTYPNPNRFFCHYGFRVYFRSAPLLLQRLVDPVTSVYLASALAKLLVHAALLYLLAVLIVGRVRGGLVVVGFMTLLTPFFQAAGYRSYMGIIDPSVTYTFFYALPTALTMLFMIPFVRHLYHGFGWPVAWWRHVILALLAVVVCLSGPLNPGIVLVLSATWLSGELLRRGLVGTMSYLRSLPRSLLLLGFWVAVLAGYSLFVGRYNSLSEVATVPLLERYGRLPEGVYQQFFQKLGFPLLFGVLLLFHCLSRFGKASSGEDLWRCYKWLGGFCLLYLLLLPLGGWRAYRPYTLRYDTILPVTLSLLWLYGRGALTVWGQLRGRPLREQVGYVVLLVGIGLVFTNADRAETVAHSCEAVTLRALELAAPDTIFLRTDCPVMSWGTPVDPTTAADNRVLLRHWNIID